jgi:hypothetical protein
VGGEDVSRGVPVKAADDFGMDYGRKVWIVVGSVAGQVTHGTIPLVWCRPIVDPAGEYKWRIERQVVGVQEILSGSWREGDAVVDSGARLGQIDGPIPREAVDGAVGLDVSVGFADGIEGGFQGFEGGELALAVVHGSAEVSVIPFALPSGDQIPFADLGFDVV